MALSIVHHSHKGNTANAGSIDATFVSTTAGNLLVALLNFGGNGTITLPTNWAKIIEQQGGTSQQLGLYYLKNCSAGLTTQTFTFPSSNGGAIDWFEIAGADTSAPLDKSTSNTGTSTTPTTGTTAATTVASEIIIAGVGYNGGAALTISNILNGYANTETADGSGSSNNPHAVELDLIVSTTGTQSTGCTLSASKNWTAVIATFKAAAAGGGPPPSTTLALMGVG